MSSALQPHGLQDTMLPYPPPTPRACSNSCHQVSDSTQPSHPLSSPLLPPLIFPSIRVFSNELPLCIRWTKYWNFSFIISPFNEYSGLVSLGFTGWISLLSKVSQESSLAQQFKSISSSALSLLYGPSLTSVHDYWKNHSFD